MQAAGNRRGGWSSGRRLALAAVTLGTAVAAAPAAAATYRVVDLGDLGGGPCEAAAVNEVGQVAGTCPLPDGTRRAFRWTSGRLVSLGTLPGGTSSGATDINATGQVAGWSTRPASASGYGADEERRAVRFDAQGPRDLGVNPGYSFPYGAPSSTAAAINDAGTVVGTTVSNSQDPVPFVHDGRAMRIVSVPDGVGEAQDVTPDGRVLGTLGLRATEIESTAGFFGSATAAARVGDAMVPVAVNASGTIVGRGIDPGGTPYDGRAFVLQDGVVTFLGSLGGPRSSADAVNASGRVVGQADTDESDSGRPHAFLFAGGRLVDLNGLLPAGSGWTLTSASDINDRGQIVATGTFEGRTRAVLLTPEEPVATAAPAPAPPSTAGAPAGPPAGAPAAGAPAAVAAPAAPSGAVHAPRLVTLRALGVVARRGRLHARFTLGRPATVVASAQRLDARRPQGLGRVVTAATRRLAAGTRVVVLPRVPAGRYRVRLSVRHAGGTLAVTRVVTLRR